MTNGITIVTANQASWEDLPAILGPRGYAARCQCQRFKLGPHGWTSFTRQERAETGRCEVARIIGDVAKAHAGGVR